MQVAFLQNNTTGSVNNNSQNTVNTQQNIPVNNQVSNQSTVNTPNTASAISVISNLSQNPLQVNRKYNYNEVNNALNTIAADVNNQLSPALNASISTPDGSIFSMKELVDIKNHPENYIHVDAKQVNSIHAVSKALLDQVSGGKSDPEQVNKLSKALSELNTKYAGAFDNYAQIGATLLQTVDADSILDFVSSLGNYQGASFERGRMKQYANVFKDLKRPNTEIYKAYSDFVTANRKHEDLTKAIGEASQAILDSKNAKDLLQFLNRDNKNVPAAGSGLKSAEAKVSVTFENLLNILINSGFTI